MSIQFGLISPIERSGERWGVEGHGKDIGRKALAETEKAGLPFLLLVPLSYSLVVHLPIKLYISILHKAKTDTETNFVVTVGFTTKIDYQTTSKIHFRRFSKSSDDRPRS